MALFLTFEGIEGCGKSTQVERLASYLEGIGKKVRLVREPGSTRLGEQVREILLTGEPGGMDQWSELFLYEACRAELVSKVIRPALNAGELVICDRFIDSTVAYQGFGRGLDIDTITELNTLATGGLTPGLTIVLDCPVELGLSRALKRMDGDGHLSEDRFEREDLDFHTRVRHGFLQIAKNEPKRVKLIDASGDIGSVTGRIQLLVDNYLTG